MIPESGTNRYLVTFSAGTHGENAETLRSSRKSTAVTSWTVIDTRHRVYDVHSYLSPGDLSAELVRPEQAVHVRSAPTTPADHTIRATDQETPS